MRTGPFNNGGAPAISATFLNNLENVLEQPSGGSETGKYYLIGNWAGAGSGFFGSYMSTISRTATPVSVTVDQADQAASGGAAAPSTANLTSNGFKVYSSMSNGNNGIVGGNTTVNY